MFNNNFFKVFLYVCLSVIGLIVIFNVGNYIKIRSSNEYHLAVEFIKSNQSLLSEIGEIKEISKFPSGSITKTNGNKIAQIQICVKASKENGKVIVFMKKGPNQDWEYTKILFKKDE